MKNGCELFFTPRLLCEQQYLPQIFTMRNFLLDLHATKKPLKHDYTE
jgi:hypothetical protein